MSNYSQNKIVDDPNHVWNRLANMIEDGSEVMDVGCSSGNFGENLIAKKGCIVDGVELDSSDAKIASKKLRNVWNLNIEQLVNLKKLRNKYDVVVFADVLEHLYSPSDTLRAVKRLLKPGGRIIFSIPNMAHISVRLNLLGGDFVYTDTGLLDKTHLHFYDFNAIKTVFKDANMYLTSIDGVVYGYPDKLIHDKLGKLGFQAEEQGMRLLRDPSSSIFQYVGSAEYGNRDEEVKINSQMPVLSQDIQNLVNELQNKDEKVKDLHKRIDDLLRQIDVIEHSTTFRVGNFLTRLPRAMKARFKR